MPGLDSTLILESTHSLLYTPSGERRIPSTTLQPHNKHKEAKLLSTNQFLKKHLIVFHPASRSTNMRLKITHTHVEINQIEIYF